MTKRKDFEPERELTVEDCGRRGGTTTKERYGLEFYRRIGKKSAELRKRKQEENDVLKAIVEE